MSSVRTQRCYGGVWRTRAALGSKCRGRSYAANTFLSQAVTQSILRNWFIWELRFGRTAAMHPCLVYRRTQIIACRQTPSERTRNCQTRDIVHKSKNTQASVRDARTNDRAIRIAIIQLPPSHGEEGSGSLMVSTGKEIFVHSQLNHSIIFAPGYDHLFLSLRLIVRNRRAIVCHRLTCSPKVSWPSRRWQCRESRRGRILSVDQSFYQLQL